MEFGLKIDHLFMIKYCKLDAGAGVGEVCCCLVFGNLYMILLHRSVM